MALDEAAARRDLTAHEHSEDAVSFSGILDLYLQQRAPCGVHGGFPELVWVHFAQPLVALQGHLALAQGCHHFLQLGVRVDVLGLFAGFHQVERGLCQKEVSLFDKRLHVAEEERQQQGGDMRPVYVSVAHDDDAIVADVIQTELIPYATAQCGNDCLDFPVAQNFVECGAFSVENLAAQR